MGSNQLVELLEKLDWSKRFTIECGRDAFLESNFNVLWFVRVSAIAFVIK